MFNFKIKKIFFIMFFSLCGAFILLPAQADSGSESYNEINIILYKNNELSNDESKSLINTNNSLISSSTWSDSSQASSINSENEDSNSNNDSSGTNTAPSAPVFEAKVFNNGIYIGDI